MEHMCDTDSTAINFQHWIVTFFIGCCLLPVMTVLCLVSVLTSRQSFVSSIMSSRAVKNWSQSRTKNRREVISLINFHFFLFPTLIHVFLPDAILHRYMFYCFRIFLPASKCGDRVQQHIAAFKYIWVMEKRKWSLRQSRLAEIESLITELNERKLNWLSWKTHKRSASQCVNHVRH